LHRGISILNEPVNNYCSLFIYLFIKILNLFTSEIYRRTPEEVLAAKGVKPTLSPNLNTLALVEVC
jgi:hypothetical protein